MAVYSDVHATGYAVSAGRQPGFLGAGYQLSIPAGSRLATTTAAPGSASEFRSTWTRAHDRFATGFDGRETRLRGVRAVVDALAVVGRALAVVRRLWCCRSPCCRSGLCRRWPSCRQWPSCRRSQSLSSSPSCRRSVLSSVADLVVGRGLVVGRLVIHRGRRHGLVVRHGRRRGQGGGVWRGGVRRGGGRPGRPSASCRRPPSCRRWPVEPSASVVATADAASDSDDVVL